MEKIILKILKEGNYKISFDPRMRKFYRAEGKIIYLNSRIKGNEKLIFKVLGGFFFHGHRKLISLPSRKLFNLVKNYCEEVFLDSPWKSLIFHEGILLEVPGANFQIYGILQEFLPEREVDPAWISECGKEKEAFTQKRSEKLRAQYTTQCFDLEIEEFLDFEREFCDFPHFPSQKVLLSRLGDCRTEQGSDNVEGV